MMTVTFTEQVRWEVLAKDLRSPSALSVPGKGCYRPGDRPRRPHCQGAAGLQFSSRVQAPADLTGELV